MPFATVAVVFAYHQPVIKLFGSSSDSSAPPLPNTYWVEPGRLLAGEYPGATREESQDRLRALLKAGFTSFIDLTGEDELPAYHHEFEGRDIVHRRFPIVDHGIPSSPALMDDVATAIENDLEEGRRVYVHCRAGIGRTGMAIACYLIHQGLDGEAALDKLQALWRRCSRARSWPMVPETEDQIRFVRTWVSGSSEGAGDSRVEGALIGLGVGEALTLAMQSRRSESKSLERIAGGVDTAMTLAALESLLERGGHDAKDQLQRYVALSQQPQMQTRVPAELKRVLAAWQWSRKPNAASHDPKNVDAHPMARTIAAVLLARNDAERAAESAVELARTTLQSPIVLDLCRIWAALLVAALQGTSKQELLTLRPAHVAVRQRQLRPIVSAILQGDWRRTEPLDGAPSVLASTLDIFRFTHSFEVAIREAARVGTTCAALVGSLAGAHYGIRSIPSVWREALTEGDRLMKLAAKVGR